MLATEVSPGKYRLEAASFDHGMDYFLALPSHKTIVDIKLKNGKTIYGARLVGAVSGRKFLLEFKCWQRSYSTLWLLKEQCVIRINFKKIEAVEFDGPLEDKSLRPFPEEFANRVSDWLHSS